MTVGGADGGEVRAAGDLLYAEFLEADTEAVLGFEDARSGVRDHQLVGVGAPRQVRATLEVAPGTASAALLRASRETGATRGERGAAP